MENNITNAQITPQGINSDNKPAKKTWQKPEIYVLDRDEEVNNGLDQGTAEGFKSGGAQAGNYHS